MNSLVVAFVTTILSSSCVSAGIIRYSRLTESSNQLDESLPNNQSSAASKPSDSEAAASHLGWGTLGYSGPTAIPEILGDGTIAETPEVAAARAAHLSALESARVANPDLDDGEYDPYKYGDHNYGVVSHHEDILNNILFYGSLAKGHHAATVAPVNTHAQAKASGDAEVALALWQAKTTSDPPGISYGSTAEQNQPYFGPLAMLEVLSTGYLADTPEVASARQTHLSALTEAKAAADLWRAKFSQHHPWN